MQFSHVNDNGGKAGKFALIAGMHVVVGILFVQSMYMRSISHHPVSEPLTVTLDQERPITPPPPQPPQAHSDLQPPKVFVPALETDVTPPPSQPTVQATTVADIAPMRPAVVDTGPAEPPATPVTPATNPPRMRTAVFADAKACALPEYPPRALRNGDTGTTQLALLVGFDGRVTSARVERSSGSHDLDRAAVNALSLCRFQPATTNGVPESGWAQLSYVWTLD